MNEKLLASIRFYFAQCVFMNSIYYKAYDRLNSIQKRDRKIVFSIAATTLIIIILQVIGLEGNYQKLLNILSYCGLLLTGTSLIFAMYNKEDISEIKNQHRKIAEEYKIIRDQYMSLIEEVISNAFDDDTLRLKSNELQKQYGSIGKYAPRTTASDYKKTQIGLGIGEDTGEEFTWSNEEINKFLPLELRLN